MAVKTALAHVRLSRGQRLAVGDFIPLTRGSGRGGGVDCGVLTVGMTSWGLECIQTDKTKTDSTRTSRRRMTDGEKARNHKHSLLSSIIDK